MKIKWRLLGRDFIIFLIWFIPTFLIWYQTLHCPEEFMWVSQYCYDPFSQAMVFILIGLVVAFVEFMIFFIIFMFNDRYLS